MAAPAIDELRHLLHRKALASERHRSALGRSLGITDSEATALAHVVASGQLTPRELARRVGLSSGGVTALVHRLERAGHLVRRPHPRDGRSILLAPSASYLAQAERRYAPLVAEIDRAAARLTEEQRALVAHYLEEVTAISERHAERGESPELDDVVVQPATGLWA
jgi:DNA-binding MarR family transcriptional regulator